MCNEAPGQKKRVLIILDLDVVALGQDINMKIGNPVQMGADGIELCCYNFYY